MSEFLMRVCRDGSGGNLWGWILGRNMSQFYVGTFQGGSHVGMSEFRAGTFRGGSHTGMSGNSMREFSRAGPVGWIPREAALCTYRSL